MRDLELRDDRLRDLQLRDYRLRDYVQLRDIAGLEVTGKRRISYGKSKKVRLHSRDPWRLPMQYFFVCRREILQKNHAKVSHIQPISLKLPPVQDYV